jgi:molecular chaperone DnaK (HSP70)
LGGDDFDRALLDLLLSRLSAARGPAAAAAAAADPAAAAALLAAAEGTKIALSEAGSAPVKFPPGTPGGLAGFETAVTRAELVVATAALRERLWPPLAAAATECKLKFPGSGPAFEARLSSTSSASGASSSGRSSGSSGRSSDSSGGSGGSGAGDKYAPKPRAATAAVLVGGATRMPVVRDYVQHVTGLQPRWVARGQGGSAPASGRAR